MFWNAVGNNASLGMEVWHAEAYSQYITHHTLNKTISEQPWVSWNGVPIADTGMCSVPITPSSFQEKTLSRNRLLSIRRREERT